MQLSFNAAVRAKLFHGILQSSLIFLGSPFEDFQCENLPHDTPSNVTELQFCDGMINCKDESDEPEFCRAGTELSGHTNVCRN